jgi:hypothetical protein
MRHNTTHNRLEQTLISKSHGLIFSVGPKPDHSKLFNQFIEIRRGDIHLVQRLHSGQPRLTPQQTGTLRQLRDTGPS